MSYHYPQPPPRARPTSYIPQSALPSSSSFRDEVDLDLRQHGSAPLVASPIAPEGAYGQTKTGGNGFRGGVRGGGSGEESGRGQGHARQESNGSSVFRTRLRPRSQHESSPYGHGNGMGSAYGNGYEAGRTLPHEAEGGPTYGMHDGDEAQSLHLAGEPPKSTAGGRPPIHAAGQSTTSFGGRSAATTAMDYLYLEEEDQGYEGYGGNGRVCGAHGGEEEDRNRENENLTKQESWYFLRALVGQELRHEERLLWKLKNLDGSGGPMNAFADGSYDEYLDPSEAPILRYLIRHFLLTLPLVRDVGDEGQDVPTFWQEGLYPIIRAFHNGDFSQPVDRGNTHTTFHLYESTIRNALERFVSAGLKLSSSNYESSTGSGNGNGNGNGNGGPQSIPMEQRVTSSSTRYNFQPAVPPPAEPVAPPPPAPRAAEKTRPTSAASSASTGRRFSLGRLFGGTSSPPVQTAPPPSQPPLPTHIVTSPSLPSSFPSSTFTHASQLRSASDSEGELFPDARRTSAGPARPDSACIPTPFNPYLPPAPLVPALSARAAGYSSGVEELDFSRSESRATGATGGDTASFVSAHESSLVRTSSEESGMFASEEGGAATTRIEGVESAGGQNLAREPSVTGTLRPVVASGAATDTEGFEYYASDAALTPKHEEPPFSSPGPEQQTPKGKGRLATVEAEPYTVDDLPSTSSLAPPVPFPANFVTASTSASATPRPQTPINISPTSSTGGKNSRRNKFGLGGILKGRRGSQAEEKEKEKETAAEAPSHREVPTSDDFVSHMAIPSELLQPMANGSSTEDETYSPREMALPPVLVPKGGVPWPFNADVEFVRGPEFERLAWGGFEADVVGVRRGLFSHSYIIRVRRPARLDEYVIRSEAQFQKFYKALNKAYPQAHVRRVPTADLKNDQIIRPKPSLATINSSASLVSGVPGTVDSPYVTEPLSRSASRSRSRLVNGLRAAAADPRASLAPSRASNRNSSGSTFARSLRAQSIHTSNASEVRSLRIRHQRSTTSSSELPMRPHSVAGTYRTYATTLGLAVPVEIGKKMPKHDGRRRALRVWLRDALSIRTVGHQRETAAFLLLGSIVPKDSDVIDIAKRELIDDARRIARLNAASSIPDRVKATRKVWSSVEKEIIHGEGLSEISAALKNISTVSKLPMKYQKVLESMRFNLAEILFDVLVAGESSGSTFTKLKALHSAFPYFLVKQALRLKGSSLMARALQDLLLARPFGNKSLLQKILATCLDDDPVRLVNEMNQLQARIGSAAMCEKLSIFVHESRDKKAIIRRYAEENNIELVLCIVRGADEPRLPGFELDRITKASKAYRKFSKSSPPDGPTPLAKAQVQDPDIRLVLDLQAYLLLASKDRDANVFREMLATEEFAAAIEVVAKPFVAALKRTYKVGGAQALSDLQKFLDQLIIIVEALRSRVQDPQKSIRILARLLSRHQQSAYAFVHAVHKKETLVEEVLQWAWTASVFLRRGLATPISLDDLLPPPHSEESSYLLDDLSALLSYHSSKRLSQFESSARRYAGDCDADDPILVEGDGKGKSRVEMVREERPRWPVLGEIGMYAQAFQEQLKEVFAV